VAVTVALGVLLGVAELLGDADDVPLLLPDGLGVPVGVLAGVTLGSSAMPEIVPLTTV
jgi:hypothetical protein